MPTDSRAAHTPGPWEVRGQQDDDGWNEGRHIYAPQDRYNGRSGCVALVKRSQADARLIAAAPELAEGLREAVKALTLAAAIIGRDERIDEPLESARAALAEAGL